MINSQIFNMILFAIDKIESCRDWRPFDELVLGLSPENSCHSGQYEFLEKSIHRENGLHPGNGWGKTSVIAKKHIYFILKHFSHGDKYKTLNVAITQDQAELVQDEMMRLISNSPTLASWLVLPNGSVKFPHAKIRYCNGAQTEFKSTKKKGESIEGKEYGYISVDEVALELYLEFIRDKILLPRTRAKYPLPENLPLDSPLRKWNWQDSQIDYSATPKGYTAFYRILENIKRTGGYVRGGSSYENPHIDHTLLDYFKTIWSEAKVAQMIEGKFIDTAEMMFASRVDKLFDENLTFEEVTKGAKYVEGWDLARGRKGKAADSTVGFRLDVSNVPARIVKRWSFQLPWTEKERENIKSMENIIHRSSIEREIRQSQYESKAKVFIDSTGVGDTLYGIVQDIAKPVDFRGGNKDFLLDHLQAVIDAGLVKCPFIPELADEMTVYQREDKNLDTDNLMALAVACSSLAVKSRRPVEVVPVDVFAR
jgi:hypothetical protein